MPVGIAVSEAASLFASSSPLVACVERQYNVVNAVGYLQGLTFLLLRCHAFGGLKAELSISGTCAYHCFGSGKPADQFHIQQEKQTAATVGI